MMTVDEGRYGPPARRPQNPPGATPCEFDSHLGHSRPKLERPAVLRGPFDCRARTTRYGVPASAASAVARPAPVASAPQQMFWAAPEGWATSATMPATCGEAMEVPPRKK